MNEEKQDKTSIHSNPKETVNIVSFQKKIVASSMVSPLGYSFLKQQNMSPSSINHSPSPWNISLEYIPKIKS